MEPVAGGEAAMLIARKSQPWAIQLRRNALHHRSVLAFPVNGRLQALSAGKPGSATAPDSLSLFHFNTTGGERNT